MRQKDESDFARHRLTRRFLAVSVAFALLYGFLMVDFVDSTYSPSNTPATTNGNFACTYPSSSGCGTPGLCTTVQNCVDITNATAPQSPLPLSITSGSLESTLLPSSSSA